MSDGRRVLGTVTLDDGHPPRTPEQQVLADKAIALLREEVERIALLRAEFAAEKARGAPAQPPARHEGAVARLEGASRMALRLGLITPGEARSVWAEAAKAGLTTGGDA
ncbi:MAG: hypothetical protein QOE45_1943 [Frankiaceae bacterium]|jgi:hypothetical protein|nr:hypothetical protein [Frankiaceae bacterium]